MAGTRYAEMEELVNSITWTEDTQCPNRCQAGWIPCPDHMVEVDADGWCTCCDDPEEKAPLILCLCQWL